MDETEISPSDFTAASDRSVDGETEIGRVNQQGGLSAKKGGAAQAIVAGQSYARGNAAMDGYSNLLRLGDFFRDADDYVVLKLSETFPNYHDHSDIDILCRDRELFLKRILEVGKLYETRGFRIEVSHGALGLHVDFFAPGAQRLNFRFDLIDKLGYTKFRVTQEYAHVVLGGARRVNAGGVTIFTPAFEHDLALRFLEFVEHHDTRPDKIKHWEYIKAHYRPDFVNVVNQYTDLQVSIEQVNGGLSLHVDRKESSSAAGQRKTSPESSTFYPVSETCQIPDLDAIYQKYFGRRTDGCFVEVGAFDGEYVSNTSGLADIGWTGHYIEPVPEYAERCKARHARNSRVTVSQVAIGAEPATVEINVAGPLSTISERARRNFQSLDWAKGYFAREERVTVRQLTLNDYLEQHAVKPGFELLSVDVEGYEWEVLRNFDIKKWRPQMVVIELHDQNENYLALREDCKKIVQYFSEHDYKPIYKDSSNTIYVSAACPAPRSRMDFFMIWGHGLRYTRDIVDTLRRVKDFEIVTIVKKQVGDIAQFVQDVYSCDSFPYEHLVAKTRYLLQTQPEIIFILIRNNNPQEQWKGEGAFRRVQCMLIKDVKEAIRNRFNPRKPNGKRTEHHVVHASDFESQVEHILGVLGLPPLPYYKRRPHPDLEGPFHLEPFDDYAVCEVRIDDLRANILGSGLVPIAETPHYHYLLGDRQVYERYHETYLGTKLTEDHFPEAYDRMISAFRYDYWTPDGRRSLILAQPEKDGTYRILDGVHRAAILKQRGAVTVTIAEPIGKVDSPSRAAGGGEAAEMRGETVLQEVSSRPVESHSVRTAGPVLSHAAAQERPVITMSSLGRHGRFGNQIFQYVFLRIYAQEYNLRVETPAWIGQELFGFSDPPIRAQLPLAEMPNGQVPFWLDSAFRDRMPLAGVDFKGYFQYHTKYYAGYKEFLRSLFRPRPPIEARVRVGLESLRRRGKTLVGLRLRRGDFGHDHHFIAPTEWYKEWLHGFWDTLEEPVLFVASDQPEAVTEDFREYRPVTGADLNVPLAEAPYYLDHYILTQCDAVAVSNSTFSFLACMFNERANIFVRPRLSCRKLIPFDPWNSTSNFKDEKVETPTRPAAERGEPDGAAKQIEPVTFCPSASVNTKKESPRRSVNRSVQSPDKGKPKVSVLMAVYNGERFLRQALASIYGQTYQDFEVVVVDDASTDRTADILLQMKDSRTVIHRNDANLGLTKSLNIGLQQCRGDYVARMDADDVSHLGRLKRQVQFLERHRDIALVGSSYYRIDAEGIVAAHIEVPTDDDQIREMMRQKCAFGHGTVTVRRNVLVECGGYDERFACAQDYDLWLRISEKYKLANLSEPLYCWRSTPQCISNARTQEQKRCKGLALRKAESRRRMAEGLASRPAGGAAPLVSVIVPTYNRPDTLRRAIASILDQTYQNLEIVVANDGGADVADVIRQCNIRGNITYLSHVTHRGQGVARNTALRAARGKYIAYLDDDDMYYSDHIEQLVTALETTEYKVAHTEAHRAHQEKRDGRYVEIQKTNPYPGDVNHEELLVRNLVPVLCVMHEKACLDDVGYFDEALPTHEDWDLWIRMSRRYRFLHVQQVTAQVTWRTDGSTMTSQRRREFVTVPPLIYEKYRHFAADKPAVQAEQRKRLEKLRAGHGVPTASALVDKGGRVGGQNPANENDRNALSVPAGTKRLARRTTALKGPLNVAIKICTPSREMPLWGDTWFGQGLAKAVAKAGHTCNVHFQNEWDQPDHDIDVAIHIKGKFTYTPKPHCVNILWIISHPELHTIEEINRYDAVFCASRKYFDQVKGKVAVPCLYLPQATDSEIFKPLGPAPAKDIDVLFVGTNYGEGKGRRIVRDVLATGKDYDLWVIGLFWKGRIDERYIKAEYVDPRELPGLYSRAKIVLNSHHGTMQTNGFVNNRTYDVAAVRAFQISDEVEGLDELGVVTYRTPAELAAKLDYYLAHDAEREKVAALTRERCRDFTFTRAAETILGQARQLREGETVSPEGDRVVGAESLRPADLQTQGEPGISVVVACHNCAEFLSECIDSIRAQTLSQWELFLLDDGSTDGTRRIIEEYVRRDARIKPYCFDDNRGPYVRRNFAIERASAPFIVIQDSDDLMSPVKLDTLYNEIKNDDSLAMVGAFYRTFLERFQELERTDPIELPLGHDEIAEKMSAWRHGISHVSAIIRKSMFERIGPYDENPFASDSFWSAKLAEYARHCPDVRFKNVPAYLTLYRVHATSQTQVLSTVDPRNRRVRYRQYCECKLQKIREKAAACPILDIAAELRGCDCSDFLTRFKAQIIKWESEPVQPEVMWRLLETVVALFNNRSYVSCVSFLNGIEIMDRGLAERFLNFDLLKAMALYALNVKESSLSCLHREIENHENPAAREFLRDFFERGQTQDVQKWCAEHAGQFSLEIEEAPRSGLGALCSPAAASQKLGRRL